MSHERSRARRAVLAAIVTTTALVAAPSCGFPDHSFVDDDEFFGRADASAGGATGGTGGSSTTGNGGTSAGGTSAGGTSAGGTSGDGGGSGATPGSGGTTADGGSTAAGGAGPDGGTGGTLATGGATGDGGTGGATVRDAGPIDLGDAARPDAGGPTDSGTPPDASDGAPTCDPGLSPCGASCFDLQSDDARCGTCDNACSGGLVCRLGACVSPCDPGLDLCAGAGCVDLQGDRDHCGSCPNACSGTDLCRAGNCTPPCGPGLTLCAGLCVDTDTDESFCGGCARPACAGGFVCENGSCVIDCADLTRCGVQCVDVTSDEDHCGTCPTKCPSGDVCVQNQCRPNCALPFKACGQACVNPTSDEAHCGDCNQACGAQQDCVAGSCVDLVELCQNGVDDDRDGDADCADSDCGTFTCAASPAGWTGPVALWSGTPGTAPSCAGAGGYPSAFFTANGGLVVPPSTCPACNCVPSGASCDDLEFYWDTTTDCSSSRAWFPILGLASGVCDDWILAISGGQGARSSELMAPLSSYVSGSCAPSGAAPQFPAPSWSTQVRACGSTTAIGGGGCGGGSLCLPRPTAPFGSALCVYKAGVDSCPADYPVQRPGNDERYYQGYTDGRSCTACSCGAPTCGGTVNVFPDDGCQGTPTPVKISGADTCTTLPVGTKSGGQESRSIRWDNAGPVCGAGTPGTLLGEPSPNSPLTVCCQAP